MEVNGINQKKWKSYLPFKTYLHRGANNSFMPNAEGVGMRQNHNERAKNSVFTMYVVGHVKLLGDVWKQNWSKVQCWGHTQTWKQEYLSTNLWSIAM
jgi:uncharacterized protein (DUF983 family)